MSKYCILVVALFYAITASAQVLDDSTKQIYSNKTVEYFYENDVLRNIDRRFNPDSSLTYYHYSDPIRRSGWMYQDLGNVGTASRSILYKPTMETGQNMGMEVNQLYAPSVSDFKYYNTRSPYTYLGYQQGGGHTQFEITHSQNITPRLNITLNVFKFNSEKIFGYQRSQEVLSNHWKYDLSTNYASKNQKYRVMATFYHFNHKNAEQGGVKNGKILRLSDVASSYSRNYDAALSGQVFNRERWNNFHLYQQFLMKNSLQTFHTLDYERKYYGFIDPLFTDSTNALEYRISQRSPIDTLAYSYRFQTISNKFGFKGVYKGINYQAYARHRMYKLTNAYYPSFTQNWSTEVFAGGLLGYVFPDSTNTLDVKAEISDKSYLLDALLFYKGFEIGFYNSALPAGLFYQKFRNEVIDFSRNSDLKAINSKHFTTRFPVKYKSFQFIPEFRFSSIQNHTYLEDVDQVRQLDGSVNLTTLGVEALYKSPRLAFRYQVFYNTTNSKAIYPVPDFIHFSNLEYNFLYAKVLRIHTGLDFYFKSRYLAHNYSPLVNQFIAVQDQQVGGVPVFDVYIKFPISKGRIALNYMFMNKGWMGRQGVFTTPGYLNRPSSLMIKLDWPLFD